MAIAASFRGWSHPLQWTRQSWFRRIRDKHFHKFVNRKVKYRAHDENNDCNNGDVVELIASRPYSKTKRWRVVRTIEKARAEL